MGPVVLTIGNFDGVHLGHVALLEETRRLAEELRAGTHAITFRPHPIAILRPESAPPLLTTYDEKLELMRGRGFEVSEVAFTPELATTSAEEFLERVIFKGFKPQGIVVGHDFRFGRGRQGGFDTLSDACLRHGTVLRRAPALKVSKPDGTLRIVSSSAIREALAEGDITTANTLLGREFTYSGEVSPGQGKGRTIGFPTANLLPTPGKALLPLGVYATRVSLSSGESVNAVTNVGVRPTIGENLPVVIETHLLDFERDLYRQNIVVRFVARIRGERKFSSVAELHDQISKDRQKSAEILAARLVAQG